ncbi:MAG: zf-TFIIB domain-containing protein [Myxococcota bacterium]
MRRCPKCHPSAGLSVETVQGDPGSPTVEIDVCPRCRGVWLDWTELGDLVELRELITGLTSGADWQRDLELGMCPDDGKALQRLEVGAYAVDRCPECEGLWLDGGELGPSLTREGFQAVLRALRQHPV